MIPGTPACPRPFSRTALRRAVVRVLGSGLPRALVVQVQTRQSAIQVVNGVVLAVWAGGEVIHALGGSPGSVGPSDGPLLP